MRRGKILIPWGSCGQELWAAARKKKNFVFVFNLASRLECSNVIFIQ